MTSKPVIVQIGYNDRVSIGLNENEEPAVRSLSRDGTAVSVRCWVCCMAGPDRVNLGKINALYKVIISHHV